MPNVLTIDLDAPPAATLGTLTSLADQLAALPGLIDIWRVDPARITRDVNDRVSAWTGQINSRQFTQVTAARQPLYLPASRIDFGNASASRATMLLGGTQLGQLATGSIGLHLVLEAGDATVDNQNIAGQDLVTTGTGIVRLAYRYAASGIGNYVRASIGTSTTNLDLDLNAGVTAATIWLTIDAGQARLRVNGMQSAGSIPVASLNLPSFALGGSREGTPSLTGGLLGACITTSILSDSERAAAEWAMSNPV